MKVLDKICKLGNMMHPKNAAIAVQAQKEPVLVVIKFTLWTILQAIQAYNFHSKLISPCIMGNVRVHF